MAPPRSVETVRSRLGDRDAHSASGRRLPTPLPRHASTPGSSEQAWTRSPQPLACRGALYAHFSDKDRLFVEVVVVTVKAVSDPVHDEVQRLRDLVMSLLTYEISPDVSSRSSCSRGSFAYGAW